MIKELTITVTKEDIETGKVGSTKACPVAKALMRAGIDRPAVWPTLVYYSILAWPGSEYCCSRRVDVPSEVTGFIKNFDNDIPVQPFEFNIAMEVGPAYDKNPNL